MDRLPPRVRSKIRIDDAGCWIWTGAKKGNGYGNFYWEGKLRLTHRVIYALLRGPIPEGMVIDHLCRNRACQNPEHMEVVTPRENCLRGDSPSARHARKTHCPRGHEYTPENTYLYSRPRQARMRICKTCSSEWCRAYRQRVKDRTRSNAIG